MWIFWYILALLLTVLTWYLLLRLCSKHSQHYFYILEYGIYSFLIGVVVIPFVLFIFAWMGVQLSLMWMLFLVLWLNILLLILNIVRKTKLHFASSDIQQQFLAFPARLKIWSLLFAVWLLVKLIFGFMDITNVPTYQDDTFGNWNYRAKVFYERESLVLDKQDKDYLWQGYKQYPLTPSLYKTYLMKFTGYRHEWLVNLPSFLFYISALLLVFFWLLRITKKLTWAWLWALLLSWIPLYYIHWTNPYFDVFQSVYLFVVIYSLYQIISSKESQWISFLLFGMFLAFLGLTKNEWLTLFLPLCLFLWALAFLYKKNVLKDSLKYKRSSTLPYFLLPIVFIVFKFIYGLWFGNGNNQINQSSLSYSSDALRSIWHSIFSGGWFGLFFFLFFIIILGSLFKDKFDYKKDPALYFLIFSVLFLFIVAIVLLIFVWSLQLEAISQTWSNRMFIQLMLLFVFCIVLCVYNLTEKNV